MVIKDLVNKYKIQLIIVGTVVIFAFGIYVSNSFPRDSVLQDILTKQEQKIREEFKKQIEEKDTKIQELTTKLEDSQKVVTNLNISIEKLKKARGDLHAPISTKETIERFNNLGYPTIKSNP